MLPPFSSSLYYRDTYLYRITILPVAFFVSVVVIGSTNQTHVGTYPGLVRSIALEHFADRCQEAIILRVPNS